MGGACESERVLKGRRIGGGGGGGSLKRNEKVFFPPLPEQIILETRGSDSGSVRRLIPWLTQRAQSHATPLTAPVPVTGGSLG